MKRLIVVLTLIVSLLTISGCVVYHPYVGPPVYQYHSHYRYIPPPPPPVIHRHHYYRHYHRHHHRHHHW